MFTVETEARVAVDSPDHLFPWGTANDNHTSEIMLDEIREYFGRPYSIMDLGCSGGQSIIDAISKGNVAIGLEGSDYSWKNKRANWTEENYNKILFTCDVAKPFQVLNDSVPFKFDIITAWEFLEHIHPDELDQMFANVNNHLVDGGLFIGQYAIGTDEHMFFDPRVGHHVNVDLHQSVHPVSWWNDKFDSLGYFENLGQYPFKGAVRDYNEVWHKKFYLKKKV